MKTADDVIKAWNEYCEAMGGTPDGDDYLRTLINIALTEVWNEAIDEAAKAATILNMDTDTISGNGYGDGRRDARAKIEKLKRTI